jgi:hypothetical protein
MRIERPPQDLNNAQIGADHDVTTAQNLPKAKLIENVEEKGFTGYHKLSDHIFAGRACLADSFGKAAVESCRNNIQPSIGCC